MRIRTINEAIEELKHQDGGCTLGYGTIRKLILTGVLPEVRSGNKYLVDMDRIAALFEAPEVPQEPEYRY